MIQIKNQIALERGYPSWDDMFDFVARDGQYPVVTAQLIEAGMRDYIKRYAKYLQSQNFEGWSEQEKNGYITACSTIENGIV